MPLTSEGYPADRSGHRLVAAEDFSPTYLCGSLVFHDGNPPGVIPEPSTNISTLLSSAGAPSVDQDNFYEIYDWGVVTETEEVVAVIGHPNTNRPDFYPGTHGYIIFIRREGQWETLVADWCTPTASLANVPAEVNTTVSMWPDEYRQAYMSRDWTTVMGYHSQDEWRSLMIPTTPAEWTFDPERPPDPDSALLPILIRERNCASGQPPVGRDISAYTTGGPDGGVTLTVLVTPVTGGALCPMNPWYPITVALPKPPSDGVIYDGRTLPVVPQEPIEVRDRDFSWPPAFSGDAITCVWQYPADLAELPIAFDGTVIGIERGEYIDEAAATPVDLEFAVHHVFRGVLGATVVMHTFDFNAPGYGEAWDPIGVRVLAAAGSTLDVMACGFTRPYSPEAAQEWSAAFGD